MSTGWLVFTCFLVLAIVVMSWLSRQIRRDARSRTRTGLIPTLSISQRRLRRAAWVFTWIVVGILILALVGIFGLSLLFKVFPNGYSIG